MKKVLIGTTVRQKPEILKEYLLSLKNLKKQNLKVDYCFVDDNVDPVSKSLLKEFKDNDSIIYILDSKKADIEYIKDSNTHYWNEELVWKVAENKNMILNMAKDKGYDFVFFVDSDIVLHPNTLEHLVSLNKDIISEIFWTKWKKNLIELPQVWLSDQYNLFYKNREENVTNETISRQINEFLNLLKVPGVYKVGGVGACVLISRKAILQGVSYDKIYNISLWGEDRHFSIRAVVLGFELYVDTHFPAFHIYRDEDLKRLEKYKKYIRKYKNHVFLPGDRIAKKGYNRLTLSMIVRNEADRYLPNVLKQAAQFITNAVIIDDASTDNTENVCKEVLKNIPLIYHKNKYSKFSNEVELRKQLWELTISTNPDWILCIDADELFEDKIVKEINNLINQPVYDVIAFRIYDFWNDKQYREDKYWNAHKRYWPMLVRYQPFFEYRWKETPLYCGRFPANITELPIMKSNVRIKHFGWAREEDRINKYTRYLALDKEFKYGIKEQYYSILDKNPNLVDWIEEENIESNQSLSLCLITKDEEKNIARCINSVKDIVDEIVVVDTGSKDKTVEIAKSFGAKVIHAKWEDDFSKARNVAIENATSDWILFLDADEEIRKEDVSKIRPLLNDDTVEAYIFKFINYGGTNVANGLTEVHYNFRLFRNNGKLKYIYPIHENLRNVEENRLPIFKKADVTILHYGYLLETRIEKNKTEKYIRLISKYLEEHPDDKFQHGNLAVEYYNAKEYHKALKHLLIATKGMNVNSPSATRLIRYLIATYTALKDYDTALKIANDAKAFYIDIPDFKFLEGMIYAEQKRYEKAIEIFKECVAMGEYNGDFITMGGTGSYRAKYMTALCYEKLNKLNDAVREYIEILKENPNYQEVFIKLFDVLIKNEPPEDVYRFFEKHVDTKNPVNNAILAKLYINLGMFEMAKRYVDNINIDIEGLNSLKGTVYLGLKDYKKAIEYFDLEYGKAKEEATYQKVLCYILLKEMDKAKNLLWEISESSDKKLYMTIVGEMKAKFEEVRDSYFNLLDMLIKFQEFDLYNTILGLYVNRFGREDYEKYGQLMIRYGLEDLAMEAYIRAADLNSQNPEVYRYLAERALGQDMYDEALSLAANAFNIDRMDIDNYVLIYKIYKTIGKHDEAEKIDRMIKEIYPEINLKDRASL
ncbi:glycosyltransferase [Thermoanaerobacter sp. RKWS2]|uniref:glycosyltransferase n=1 Tax=Thermoanaerobacter sp. RKWS2 TaxID=2983842 RepID=UPI00224AC6AA|nr:glycosyltransferase [Thermoanaerobacter sp. RKWS2]UZQ83487.1 glycosyltransferase [Thermoanaerobacter sp. RKWS2]